MNPDSHPEDETMKLRFIQTLSEYCAHSSFHGVPYLADRGRHLADRLWWVVAVVLSTSLCSYAIYKSFLNWYENPVILTLSHETMPVGAIPFPAITICPMAKTSASEFNYTDVYRSIFKLDGINSRNVTEEELDRMRVVQQVCDYTFARDVWGQFDDNYSDSDMVERIIDMAPTIEEIMVSCKFRDESVDCNDLFAPTITEEGVCYSFNTLNNNEIMSNEISRDFAEAVFIPSSNWNVERGYTKLKNVDTDSYPFRVFGTGTPSSLNVILRTAKSDVDYLCGGTVPGFKIKWHSPEEDSQIWKRSILLSHNITKLFLINPNVIIAMDDIRKYSPDARNCYYSSERKLRYFKIYSQRNCETECLANYTLEQCGCVKFSMPRSKDTKVCGSTGLRCILKANSNMFQTRSYEKCKCLPSCEWLDYDVGEFQTPDDFAGKLSQLNNKHLYNMENSEFCRLVAFFQEETMIPLIRSESHTLIDLLASSGGLFGLFMGASLLSFIELIYYLIIRTSVFACTTNASD